MKFPKIKTKLTEKDIKFVTAPNNVFAYLTAGKKYEVIKILNILPYGNARVTIIDEYGEPLDVSLKASAHDKKKGNFIPSSH